MSAWRPSVNLERVKIISDLLSSLGFNGIVRFDTLEPEYRALKTLYERGVEPAYLGLIAVSAGVIDFQLGAGGAERFWSTLVDAAGFFNNLNSLSQVEKLMESFLTKPVNARSIRLKRRRIRRIFESGFSEWFTENYDMVRRKPILLWRKLAYTIGSSMEKKTMVFAMKAFDISHLICFGDYADFPWDIPIPVDFHIRQVTVSAGLLEDYGSDSEVREAWIMVLKRVKDRIKGNIHLLRIDSLVWQIGKIMYENGYDKNLSTKRIIDYMAEKADVDREFAVKLAYELTRFLEKAKTQRKSTRR